MQVLDPLVKTRVKILAGMTSGLIYKPIEPLMPVLRWIWKSNSWMGKSDISLIEHLGATFHLTEEKIQNISNGYQI